MLIITRRSGTGIVLEVTNYIIKINVNVTHRGQVRFAIDAPKEVTIHREEVYECIQQGQLEEEEEGEEKEAHNDSLIGLHLK